MLTKITLNGIKCFDYLELPCSKLNLLCGLNGSGKSTVLQALVWLMQSQDAHQLRSATPLAGDFVDFGMPDDFLRRTRTTPHAGIYLQSDQSPHTWGVVLYEGDQDDLRVDPGTVDNPLDDHFSHEEWRSLPPFGGRTLFLGAERIGPQETYPWSRLGVKGFGPRAEYALDDAFRGYGWLTSDDPRCVGRENKPGVEGDQPNVSGQRNLNSWLQEVSPGVEILFEEQDLSRKVVARYRFTGPDGAKSDPYRPFNVGFGLSYTLPVILALLSQPGTLCLIENPEAHLHPRGQTKLGELAARAAKAGVQIFAETHSDHFMNGVRIAVREGIIEPDDVKFHYFEREGNTATVTTPEIDKDGRLSEWPVGFFDQADFNLDRLLAPKDWD